MNKEEMKQSAKLRRIVAKGGNIMGKTMADMMVETARRILNGEVPVNTGNVVAKICNVHQLERKRDCDEHDRGILNANLDMFKKICKKSTKKK